MSVSATFRETPQFAIFFIVLTTLVSLVARSSECEILEGLPRSRIIHNFNQLDPEIRMPVAILEAEDSSPAKESLNQCSNCKGAYENRWRVKVAGLNREQINTFMLAALSTAGSASQIKWTELGSQMLGTVFHNPRRDPYIHGCITTKVNYHYPTELIVDILGKLQAVGYDVTSAMYQPWTHARPYQLHVWTLSNNNKG